MESSKRIQIRYWNSLHFPNPANVKYLNYTKLISLTPYLKKRNILHIPKFPYILSNHVYGPMKFPTPKPESQWAITSVDVHSLDILISGPIIPSVFSTLQFQQQDLIKGLYFNLSTLPITYPPLQVRSSSFSKLCSSQAGTILDTGRYLIFN